MLIIFACARYALGTVINSHANCTKGTVFVGQRSMKHFWKILGVLCIPFALLWALVQLVFGSFSAGGEASLTPLMQAARVGDTTVAARLIEQGADVNASQGMHTALKLAAQEGHADMVRLLLGAGADVDAGTKEDGGWTALMFAAMEGRVDIAKILLDAGAHINAVRETGELKGWTALMSAILEEHEEMVAFLIAAGADINATDSDGFSALALARKTENSAIISMLEAATD